MLIIEIIINSFLVGIILTTQFSTYPLLLKMNTKDFNQYHTFYKKSISYVVGPLMTFELVINIYNFFNIPNNLNFYYLTSLTLLFIWISTLFIQIPIHNHLNKSFDKHLVKQLISSNWIRTVLWPTKLLLLVKEII